MRFFVPALILFATATSAWAQAPQGPSADEQLTQCLFNEGLAKQQLAIERSQHAQTKSALSQEQSKTKAAQADKPAAPAKATP